jgi:myosin heavy subunit
MRQYRGEFASTAYIEGLPIFISHSSNHLHLSHQNTAHINSDPHVFAIAANAMAQLLDSSRSQIVLVSGESGARRQITACQPQNQRYRLL